MTVALFNDDAYLQECEAVVEYTSELGIVLNQTVFYAEGGGQPGDRGILRLANGEKFTIENTRKASDGSVEHILSDPGALLEPGTPVTAQIDWEYRYRHMRTHTCLHLLCALVPFPVTGGSISQAKGRLDFDMSEGVDKLALQASLNELIAADHTVGFRFISDAEMAENMALVRTMSVTPPTGQGRVRLIEIADTDLQPCGGTHVARTGEIGPVRIGKVEKKGRQNRRINLHLD